MEDILKILVAVGILLYGFVQRIRKESSRQPASYEDDLPVPEDMTVPHEEQEVSRVFMPDTTTEPAAPTPTHAPDSPPTEEDGYRIRSAEEARKAIIWGEILQRKY